MSLLYLQILHLADAVEDNTRSQEMSANALSSATYLFTYLIKLWTSMSDDEFKILQQTVTPIVSDSVEQVKTWLIIIFYLDLIRF